MPRNDKALLYTNLLFLIAATACGGLAGPPPAARATPIAVDDGAAGLGGLPAACHWNGALPDAACTPGATDPAVTQDNIRRTICTTGYTATVRPPVLYTGPLKRDLMARYGASASGSQYELDHLVPLELGGAPRSVHNLWPQPWISPGATEKDRLENYLHGEVCASHVRLAAAQRAIASDWLKTWNDAGRP